MYSFGSGFCAAAASAVGKVAADPDLVSAIIHSHPIAPVTGCDTNDSKKCDQTSAGIDPDAASDVIRLSCQVVLFAFMILINSFMWTLFSKALTASSSTTEASLLNMGFNFFFTAIFSFFLFGETNALNLRWFIGSVIMLMGLLLLNSDHQTSETIVNEKNAEVVTSDGNVKGKKDL
jgi:membrane protein insertase Oxa1/YidC/SpoIIIJ